MEWAIIDDKLVKNPTKIQIMKSKINYIPIHEGEENIVTQSWWLDEKHTRVINFTYSLPMLESMPLIADGEWINPKWKLRADHFRKYGVYDTHHLPQELRSITIPKSQITEEGIIDLGGWRNLHSFLM